MSNQQSSFFDAGELETMGFKKYGTNVLISRFARFYTPHLMEFGNEVRIDDFCILSGEIKLGNHIHISAYTALYGKYGIEIKDFSGLSPRCTVFSATDDFSGDCLIGPMVPEELTNLIKGKVIFEKYTQMGAGTVVMPGVILAEGSVTGSMSFVNKSLESWSIYIGVPVRKMKERSKSCLEKIPKVSI